jgi:hypothetical protein
MEEKECVYSNVVEKYVSKVFTSFGLKLIAQGPWFDN